MDLLTLKILFGFVLIASVLASIYRMKCFRVFEERDGVDYVDKAIQKFLSLVYIVLFFIFLYNFFTL